MTIAIVIPTYNERDNVGRLIQELQLQFQQVRPHDMKILAVDDHSPGGTEEVVRSYWTFRNCNLRS